MPLHIKPARLTRLPQTMRRDLIAARNSRGWSQAELGRRVGLPQMHISSIETGKTVPRFDTLLDLARVLDYDLLMVPRSLVPAVQTLIRTEAASGGPEPSLYASTEDEPPEQDEI